MKQNLGWKPSQFLEHALALSVPKREPDEVIVVHHFTDTPSRLQLEVERRSKSLGLSFERLVFESIPDCGLV